ncbi:MAG: DUF1801 domain-containing protein [Saprospiraceae bacterium]|nr:DUF1801 domain-containing protein [Saprospiraceae bacterium]
MDACLDYIYRQEEPVQGLMLHLHHLLSGFPELTPKIRYKIPFYYRKSWVCYLNPIKGRQVELVFIRANELSNEQGLLDFQGRKQVAGIVFASVTDIPDEAVTEIIAEALLLDESIPYPSKR